MGTTQAFRTALHIPLVDPAIGQVVTVAAPAGDAYPSYWADGAAASSVPAGSAQYQLITSGPGPGYAWVAVDGIDCGTF